MAEPFSVFVQTQSFGLEQFTPETLMFDELGEPQNIQHDTEYAVVTHDERVAVICGNYTVGKTEQDGFTLTFSGLGKVIVSTNRNKYRKELIELYEASKANEGRA